MYGIHLFEIENEHVEGAREQVASRSDGIDI